MAQTINNEKDNFITKVKSITNKIVSGIISWKDLLITLVVVFTIATQHKYVVPDYWKGYRYTQEALMNNEMMCAGIRMKVVGNGDSLTRKHFKKGLDNEARSGKVGIYKTAGGKAAFWDFYDECTDGME